MSEPTIEASTGSRWPAWLVHDDPSGPAAARLVHMALAVVSLGAWLSLGSEARVLLGWKGLTPVQMTMLQARGSDVYLRWIDFPSLFFFSDADTTIVGGCIAGALLSVLALLGVYPRVLFALNAALYLSYCLVAQTFLGFQWDNLLIESSFLAIFLSRSQRAPAAHWMGRALLFKVFFESGLAKVFGSASDWLDGTAMQHYYETAPLPTPLAWYAHHLPPAWHTFESWWTLFFELVLAWGVFLGRAPRMVSLLAFSAFLVMDFATANYGFFVPLTAVWCLLLLPEQTCRKILDRMGRLPGVTVPGRAPTVSRFARGTAAAAVVWAAMSLYVAAVPLAGLQADPNHYERVRKWRVANAYHLFARVTTEREEVEFQTSPDGEHWTAHALFHKAGPTDRAPSFVAPHQPRADFRLWFFGLNWEVYTPPYVANLLRRLCWDPEHVQPLFTEALPSDTRYVRMVYWRYHFTDWHTGHATGDWWTREKIDLSRTISCDQLGW